MLAELRRYVAGLMQDTFAQAVSHLGRSSAPGDT